MSDLVILEGARFFDGQSFLASNFAVAIKGKNIVEVAPLEVLLKHYPEGKVEKIEGILSPGFIDLQVNGCGGVLFNDDTTVETIEAMERTNWAYGVTSFLPTLITDSTEKMLTALGVVESFQETRGVNRVLGIHLEGPFISKVKRGAHNESLVRPVEEEVLEAVIAYKKKDSQRICVMTLAPECVDLSVIRRLSEAGIIVSLGHSNATEEEVFAAVEAGAKMVTHLYNGMSPITGGRQGGVLGATLASDLLYAGIIGDGLHVNWSQVKIAKKAKGDKLFLVTDAATASGTDMKEFFLGGQKIHVKEGRFLNEAGTLAGASLLMSEVIQRLTTEAGFSLEEVLPMATLYPARAIDHSGMGSLSQGMLASLTLMDENNKVCSVWVEGQRHDFKN